MAGSFPIRFKTEIGTLISPSICLLAARRLQRHRAVTMKPTDEELYRKLTAERARQHPD
jgi:hypothetical protein